MKNTPTPNDTGWLVNISVRSKYSRVNQFA
jgi:hypothetical protein